MCPSRTSSSKAPRWLNKQALRGTVWIASDIHLGEAVPKTALAFYDFLELARRHADALILCGDLFDAWIGDDHALRDPPGWLAGAQAELRATAQAIPLWLAHGNRDFLMGRALADALGARLLDTPTVLHTDAGPILLAHGDEYCTDDLAYQRFRRIVRTPWIQKAFLALPLGVRRAIAARARARSRQARRTKTMAIMDVNPAAIGQALRAAGCQTLIHGHTHRPALHALTLDDGRTARRYVLPDWDFDHAAAPRGGWIEIDAAGIRASEHPQS